MSSTEKAYFKKFAVGGESANYLKLFDALNSMKQYDERLLQKKFKDEKFIKNISVSKSYLFELILDSLRSYNRNKSLSIKAENMLGNLRILYEKELLDVFEKQLEKTAEFLIQNELTFHYLELLELERPYNFSKTKSNLLVQEKMDRELKKVLNRNRISILNEKILNWLYQHEKVKNEKEREELELLMSDPVAMEPEENFGFYGRNTFYSSWSFYYYALGDFEKSIGFKEKQFRNYQAFPVLKKTNERYMFLVLGNLLSMCYAAGNLNKFEMYFHELKSEMELSSESEALTDELELSMTILFFKLKEDFAGGIRYIEQEEQRILEKAAKFSLIRYLDICFNSAIFYFWEKDYRNALKWNNLILQNENIDKREFMLGYARIFQLIVHYELKDTRLLGSLLRSTYRYLFQRNLITDFERVMMESLKKLIKDKEGKNIPLILKSLNEELKHMAADPFKKHSMDHFDYLRWLKQKIG